MNLTEARLLLGRQVEVTLDDQIIVRGKLVGFGLGGDCEILCEDGSVHFCWPMLEVKTI